MEKYQHLSLACRVELKVLRDQGASIRGAARVLGRSASSISRELKLGADLNQRAIALRC